MLIQILAWDFLTGIDLIPSTYTNNYKPEDSHFYPLLRYWYEQHLLEKPLGLFRLASKYFIKNESQKKEKSDKKNVCDKVSLKSLADLCDSLIIDKVFLGMKGILWLLLR